MALVWAMITMALGAMLITSTLSYMVAGIKSITINEELTRELYAADAGVELAMWSIKNDISCNSSITVGGLEVNITVGTLIELPYGPVVTGGGEHVDWILVYSEVIDNEDETFTYIIHIENRSESGEPPIKLDQIGAGLPDGFTYINGSSSGITSTNPQTDGGKVTWDLGSPKPELEYGESANQTFLIEGIGIPEGYYSWVNASRMDVGVVSTCKGYKVTAQASGTIIESYVVKMDNSIYPVSWKIN